MSLAVSKLENVREQAGGVIQARCPACAEGGHDRSGEHLRIYPDGRFGCCVHPKDGEHRKRIFALVGVRKPGTFTLRFNTPPAMTATRSVKAALTAFSLGTLGTAKSESENGVPAVPTSPISDFGTFGTAIFKSRAYAREGSPNIHTSVYMCKDLECAVPSVPCAEVELPPIAAGERLPFLTADGTLSIPFDSPDRYHWWKLDGERLTIAEIRAEVKGRTNHAATV